MLDIIGFLLFIVIGLLVAKSKTGASWGAVITAVKILAIVAVFYFISALLGFG